MATKINIGKNLKDYLTRQGFLQKDFAKKLDTKYTPSAKTEYKVIKIPSVTFYVKIEKNPNVNIEDLIK